MVNMGNDRHVTDVSPFVHDDTNLLQQRLINHQLVPGNVKNKINLITDLVYCEMNLHCSIEREKNKRMTILSKNHNHYMYIVLFQSDFNRQRPQLIRHRFDSKGYL